MNLQHVTRGIGEGHEPPVAPHHTLILHGTADKPASVAASVAASAVADRGPAGRRGGGFADLGQGPRARRKDAHRRLALFGSTITVIVLFFLRVGSIRSSSSNNRLVSCRRRRHRHSIHHDSHPFPRLLSEEHRRSIHHDSHPSRDTKRSHTA